MNEATNNNKIVNGVLFFLRLVYALQTLSVLLITMYQRVGQDANLNIKTILIGTEQADAKMQKLLDQCSVILSGKQFSLSGIVVS